MSRRIGAGGNKLITLRYPLKSARPYLGGKMRKIIFIVSLLATASANASTMLLWSCNLLEGHTIDEVKTINSAWVEAVNELSEYKVQSFVLESIASSDMAAFRYIDVFENPLHWGQIRSKMEGGALDAFEEQFNEASKCGEASLYEASES